MRLVKRRREGGDAGWVGDERREEKGGEEGGTKGIIEVGVELERESL